MDDDVQDQDDAQFGGMSRRSLLKTAGVAAAVAWAAPVVMSGGTPAGASVFSKSCLKTGKVGSISCGTCFGGNNQPACGTSGTCFCFTDLKGCCWCGEDIFCSSATPCTTQSNCPAGSKCVPASCCSSPGGPGICIFGCGSPNANRRGSGRKASSR
jgi:hypothetical protein